MRSFCLVVAVNLVLLVPLEAGSQPEQSTKTGMLGEMRLKKAAKFLGLTAQQEEQLGKLQEEKAAKIKAVQQEYNDKMKAVLTEGQQKKLEGWVKMRTERKKIRGSRDPEGGQTQSGQATGK